MLDKLKKPFQILVSLAIGLGLLYLIIGYSDINGIVATFSRLSLWWIGLFLFISFLIDLTLALRWYIILRFQGYKLPFFTIMGYRIMGSSVSYITPGARVGGEAVRALMLKRQGIPSAEGFSSVILDKSLELTTYIFFGAIGMLMVLLTFNVPKITYGLMLAAFLITVYLVFKFFSKLKYEQKIFRRLAEIFHLSRLRFVKKMFKSFDDIENSMSSFMQHSMKGFMIAILMSGILWILMFGEYWVVLRMLGYNATIVETFLIGVFIGISFLIPVPAALGVQEGGQVSLFKLLGKSGSAGMVFSLIIRGRDILRTFIGLWLLSHFGVSLLGNSK